MGATVFLVFFLLPLFGGNVSAQTNSTEINHKYLCNNITWGTFAAHPWENGQAMIKTRALDSLFKRTSQIIQLYANWDDGTGDFLGYERQQWLTWASNFSSYGAQTERTPMITWQPWKKNPSTGQYGAGYNFYTTSSILNGDHDEYILNAANGLKNFGGELLLRPFHEFDGNWYPWGAQNNGPEAFKNTWRYIYNKFVEAGTTNALFVWCPNHANSQNVKLEEYFPGDQYVDWVCIDVYSEYPSVSFTDSVGKYAAPINPYERITNITKKPILIGEFGVKLQGDIPRSVWFKQLALDLPTKLPQVKALVFFNAGEYSLDSDSEASTTVASIFGSCEKPVTVIPFLTPSVYFSFDTTIDNKVILDDSGNGKNGNVLSNPQIVNGKYGRGMNFVQSSSDTQTIRLDTSNTFSGSFTVAFWMQLNKKEDTRMKICSSKPSWINPTGWQLEVYPTLNSISFVGSFDSVAAWQNLKLVYNSWMHVAITINGPHALLYLDGYKTYIIGVSPVVASTTPLFLASDGSPNAFTGMLDDFRIYNSTLNELEVTEVMLGQNTVMYASKNALLSEGYCLQMKYYFLFIFLILIF